MDDYDNIEITEFKKGGEYIIKRNIYNSFYIKVLNITKKHYHFKYENGNTTWIEKDYYNRIYTFVEDISEFQVNIEGTTFMEQKFEICPACTGSGYVPDDKSTAGTKTCSMCDGSGQIKKEP